jgi:hypothetical protein
LLRFFASLSREFMDEDDLEIEIDLGEISAPPRSAPPEEPRPSEVGTLPPRFARLVDGIEQARLRSLVAHIYARHLKALGTLEAIERVLTGRGTAEVARLFDVLRNQCANLLAYITEAVASADFLDADVKDTLDGNRFVIAHEMSKVFRMDFPALTDANEAPYSRSELTRAWGLMNNCLQQTAITLAQAFDPAACGEQLFEDYQSKIENSLTLYRDLNLLLQKVNRAQKANGILLKHSLIRHLELFRDETMHFLMYKDWAEFESFVEKIKDAFEEIESFDNVLQEFAPYLDTLIHHVGMREVLRHVGAASAQGASLPPRSEPAGAGWPAI